MKFYDYLTEFIFMEDPPKRADYIFVPGSGYGELALRAAGLYRQGYAERIVVSGKHSILKERFEGPVSPPEYVGREYGTECDFLAQVLREQGVPEQAVLRECQAGYTYENAIYTRKLLDGKKVGRAILVCQAFHARRCFLYYKLLFPETELLVCPAITQGITRENWHLDPEKIDVVLGEVERCGSQFHEILKGPLRDAE